LNGGRLVKAITSNRINSLCGLHDEIFINFPEMILETWLFCIISAGIVCNYFTNALSSISDLISLSKTRYKKSNARKTQFLPHTSALLENHILMCKDNLTRKEKR